MINLKQGLAALAVGLTVSTLASPSYAQEAGREKSAPLFTSAAF